MANGHGGYRQPSNPAPVSGPGKLSQRTDGRPNVTDLPNAEYGANQEFRAIQSGAPMGPGPGAASSVPGPQAATPPTPLGAPTQNPGQPVTAGADAGPGPGFSALGIQNMSTEVQDLRKRYGPILPLLIRKADDPRSSDQFREQVRYLLSVIL